MGDKVIKFSGCSQNEACTIVLRGASTHILDEAERSLHDALAVLYQTVQDSRVVHGGGAMEMSMSRAVYDAMANVQGKESLAMESFAKALQQLPTILCDNGGFEFNRGSVANMAELGIMESFRSKMSQLCSAGEAAEMIIRVDDIIKNAPRQRSE